MTSDQNRPTGPHDSAATSINAAPAASDAPRATKVPAAKTANPLAAKPPAAKVAGSARAKAAAKRPIASDKAKTEAAATGPAANAPAAKPIKAEVSATPAAAQPTTSAAKPKQAAPKSQTKPQDIAAKPQDTAAKPKATAPKTKATVAKPKVAPAKTRVAAEKAKATTEPKAASAAASVTPNPDSAESEQAKQQAANEKVRQAKAKLAKIAARKAKVLQEAAQQEEQQEAPAEFAQTASAPLVAAAISAMPTLEVAPPAAEAPASESLAKPKTSLPLQALRQQLPHYARLMRLDKPIGILLLLWPTFWALWLAAKGTPSLKNLVIFSLGVVLMRSAGCVINDFADRKIDGHVARTSQRPLATGAVTSREALILFVILCLTAFTLVLCTDQLTIKLSFGGLLLAASYPFMKRHTHLPQVVLGAAFAWGVPMAYAAEIGKLDKNMWVIYCAVVLWTVAYDTFYAMVDRDDDLKIGVKSTAILFGEQDRVITGMLQAMMIYAMVLVGQAAELGWVYYLGLVVASGLFIYQQVLIRYREREACFSAFLNNNWVGAAIFAGIAGDLALK
jgi:4-hydroxybenzoate polyprenyl transferase